jgi:hypothetical protein
VRCGQPAEGPARSDRSTENAAFETGPTDDSEGNEPPAWAIEAAKGELDDDASAEEIRTRAVEMVKEEQGA